MIITTIEELRNFFPAHAIDSIAPFASVLDNSEHDFLLEKLGTPLYNALCDWYNYNFPDNIESKNTSYFNCLLLISQRVVAYDAMSRAIGQHIISINNAGVNIPTADDYGKVDLDAVKTFKQSCIKEAHAAINRLLQTLEEWTKIANTGISESSSENSSESSSESSNESNSESSNESSSSSSSSEDTPTELETIVSLWRHSRYFYLSTSLLIPCATTMQEYWNIYDSREKFIQMLPDLLYIQEEIIAPAIGEDFCEALVSLCCNTVAAPTAATSAPSPATVSGGSAAVPPAAIRTIHKLRKVMAVMTEHRTLVVNTDKLRRQTAHDEAVRLLQSAIDYIKAHQEDFRVESTIYEALKLSPLYVAPASSEATPCDCPKYANNRSDSAMFVTPALN